MIKLFFLMQDLKEVPHGEINLLHWIIYILIGVVLALAGIIAYQYKQLHNLAEKSITQSERNNNLIQQHSDVTKEHRIAVEELTDVTKELLIIMRGKH